MFVLAVEGSESGNVGFVLITPDPIDVDVTPLNFTRFSGAEAIKAGDNISRTGSRLDVVDGSGSGLDADNIRGASPAAVATSGSHNDLSNIGSSDHHSRYSDSEASNAAPVQSVNGSTGDVTVEGVPSGVIAMWGGSVSNVPNGWTLCDGTDDTPDLRDRFVVGAGNQYSVDDTGGENSVQLSRSELPSHNHGYTKPKNIQKGNDTIPPEFDAEVSANITSQANTSSVGSNRSHENRPPYYALAYIQKQ